MGCTIKYLLFAINIVILVLGIVIVVIGGILASNISDFNKIIGEDHKNQAGTAAYGYIGVGSFLIVFSFFGCFGAFKEIKWMLVIYVIFLPIFSIVLFIAGLLIPPMVKGSETTVSDEMQKSLERVKLDLDVREAWDYVQKSFKCCGITLYSDWLYYALEPYPVSCCKDKNANTLPCEPHGKGCLHRFIDSAGNVQIVGFVTSFIMFFGILFTCAVLCQRKSFRQK